MEKYRKFDDPSNGLNPFTPNEIKDKLTGARSVCRSILTVVFVLLRFPLVVLALVVSIWLHTCKYALLVPSLIRWFELFIDSLIGKLLLSVFGFNNVKIQLNKEHKDYDFIKAQKNELVIKETEAEVYVCN